MTSPAGDTLTVIGVVSALYLIVQFGDRLWKKEAKVSDPCCEAHRDMSEKIDALLASQQAMQTSVTEFIRVAQASNAMLQAHTQTLTELVVTARAEQQTSATRHESLMRQIMEHR